MTFFSVINLLLTAWLAVKCVDAATAVSTTGEKVEFGKPIK
jgi:hypothetical protein